MSYDIRFGVRIDGAPPDDCYAVIGEPEYDSPTYNLRDIFEQSMDWNYSQDEWYPIKEVLPKVQRGITELTTNRKKYEKLEPKNKWGTVSSALKCLKSIVDYFDNDNFNGLSGSWNGGIPLDCIYMRW